MQSVSFRILTVDLVDKAPFQSQPSCIVRLVGKSMPTEHCPRGLNVAIWTTGFFPYFFLQVPDDGSWFDAQVADLREYVIEHSHASMQHNLVDCVVQHSHRTFGFSDGQIFPFVKMTFRTERAMNSCSWLFNKGPIQVTSGAPPQLFRVCEKKGVPTVLKSLHDRGLQPSGWVRVDAKDARDVRIANTSRLDVEWSTRLENLHPFESDDIPPFVEMSFDGEMVSQHWVFPQPTKPFDSIVQLGVAFSLAGQDVPYRQVMFCLDSVGPELEKEDGVEARVHQDERDLMMDFHRFIVEENPDIITGYNINGFDLPYLLRRAKTLGLENLFFCLGRFAGECTELKVSYKSRQENKPKNKVRYDVPIVPGRRIEDAHKSVKKLQKKLRSYKLDDVAHFYLGVGKHDVEPEDIFRAYQDTTDRQVANQQRQTMQRFLTEIRLVQAFVRITSSLEEVNPDAWTIKVDALERSIQNKWPAEFRDQIQRAWRHVLRQTDMFRVTDWTKGEVDQFLNRYQELRCRNTTLVYESAMMDLEEPWMKMGGGVTLDDLVPLASGTAGATDSDSKKRSWADQADRPNGSRGKVDFMTQWERRIQAELDIVDVICHDRVTRKFAEKFWLARRDLANHQEVDYPEVRAYLAAETEKHQKWHLSEKTRVARYCMQDAILPLRLRKKHQFLISLMEMSMVTRVPCNMLMEKGETIKIINLKLLWARSNNYVVTVEALPQVHFKGANVLFPKKKYHQCHVFTLDFASLYPSLIMGNQFCWLSLVLPRDLERYLARQDLTIKPVNIGPPSNMVYHWVKDKRTALPEILHELVSNRSRVKKELAAATDPQMQIILNQRQLALKLASNSAYGFTGYKFSPWACLPIAVCTTLEGRDAIMLTKEIAETKYGAEVIYGDSVVAETPVLIRYPPDYLPQYVTVDQIPLATEWVTDACRKDRARPVHGCETWTESGWTLLNAVIRHATEKAIYRVDTPTGSVQVTEDHSLLTMDGTEITPRMAEKGTMLMHSALPITPDFMVRNTVNYAMVSRCAYTIGVFLRYGAWRSATEDHGGAAWKIHPAHQVDATLTTAVLAHLRSELRQLQPVNSAYATLVFVPGLADEFSLTAVGPQAAMQMWVDMWRTLATQFTMDQWMNAPTCLVHRFLAGFELAHPATARDSSAVGGLKGTRCTSQITSARLVFMYERCGYSTEIVPQDHATFLIQCNRARRASHWDGVVVRKELVGPVESRVVYDLETANHHFAAGVGKLVVHNTDSIMGIVDIPRQITDETARMEYVFNVAKEAAAHITTHFQKPIRLEFEKVYYPYLLISKKRYSGRKFTRPDKPDGIDTKGIEAIRRDNCPLLRDTVVGALDILGKQMDVGKAIRYAKRAFARIAAQDVSWEDLTISKTLNHDYANDNHIHVQVTRYLEEHYPLLAAEPGDRVPFVVIKLPNETRATKGYEKGYHPVLAQRHGKEPDWFHYAFNCLKKPLDRIFCIALGLEYQKGKEVQPTDYLWDPYLKKIADNDHLQTARVNGQLVMDAFTTKKAKVQVVDDDEEELVIKHPLAAGSTKPRVDTKKNADIRSMMAARN